jgi:hypothetical protein
MQPNPRMTRLEQQQTSGTRLSGMVKAPYARTPRDTMQHIVYLLSDNMIRRGLQSCGALRIGPALGHRRAKLGSQHRKCHRPHEIPARWRLIETQCPASTTPS